MVYHRICNGVAKSWKNTAKSIIT